MVARVLIIGGYGNFGSYIARRLAADEAICLLIGGRSAAKAKAFATSLDASAAFCIAALKTIGGRTGNVQSVAGIGGNSVNVRRGTVWLSVLLTGPTDRS